MNVLLVPTVSYFETLGPSRTTTGINIAGFAMDQYLSGKKRPKAEAQQSASSLKMTLPVCSGLPILLNLTHHLQRARSPLRATLVCDANYLITSAIVVNLLCCPVLLFLFMLALIPGCLLRYATYISHLLSTNTYSITQNLSLASRKFVLDDALFNFVNTCYAFLRPGSVFITNNLLKNLNFLFSIFPWLP